MLLIYCWFFSSFLSWKYFFSFFLFSCYFWYLDWVSCRRTLFIWSFSSRKSFFSIFHSSMCFFFSLLLLFGYENIEKICFEWLLLLVGAVWCAFEEKKNYVSDLMGFLFLFSNVFNCLLFSFHLFTYSLMILVVWILICLSGFRLSHLARISKIGKAAVAKDENPIFSAIVSDFLFLFLIVFGIRRSPKADLDFRFNFSTEKETGSQFFVFFFLFARCFRFWLQSGKRAMNTKTEILNNIFYAYPIVANERITT